MDNLIKYKVSLRIQGDELDPSEITEMLCITPDKAHKKGDSNTAISKKGKLIEFAPFKSGLWSINSKELDHMSLEQHIKSLLSLLYPLKNKFIELSDRGYEMDLFCGAFIHEVDQPGFSIGSDVLLKLGEMSIAIGICVYS